MTSLQMLAEQLPLLTIYQTDSQLIQICESIEQLPERPSVESVAEFLRGIQQPETRSLLAQLLVAVTSATPALTPRSIALSMRVLVAERHKHSSARNIELVWTGPSRPLVAMRRTDQALTDLIREARESITIVSFVVYKVPHVATALSDAVRRGVAVSLILESERDSQGKIMIDGFEQLKTAGLQGTAQYVWPDECRGKSKDGHVGSLHAKCAVADRRLALVSSANLTDYGLNLNMELGLLIDGGTIPARIAEHFEFLVSAGILVRRH